MSIIETAYLVTDDLDLEKGYQVFREGLSLSSLGDLVPLLDLLC